MTTDMHLEIFVSYGQLCLFNSGLERPYNDWKKQHIDQGFTWRAGSVSFSTLEEAETHRIEIDNDCKSRDGSIVLRSIRVPFDVFFPGAVEIGSISDTARFRLSPGRYQLLFELMAYANGDLPRAHFGIAPAEQAVFEIVHADPGLKPGRELLLDASPA